MTHDVHVIWFVINLFYVVIIKSYFPSSVKSNKEKNEFNTTEIKSSHVKTWKIKR
jgi:hypothetical protein